MTIYRFGNHSLVDEVAVQHSGGRGVRAYLHAREGADPHNLAALKDSITENGMHWTPLTHEGKAVIEVRNIGKNGKEILHFLTEQKATQGVPDKEVNPENQIKFQDKVRKNTLRLSGLFYFIGDMAFVSRGWLKSFKPETKQKEIFKKGGFKANLKPTGLPDLLSGLFYAAGSPVIAIFGKGDKSDIQLRHMSYDTLNHLENQGVNIPEDSSLRSITYRHNSTLWRKTKSKMERYPAEITNALFAVAGAMMVWSGIRAHREIKSEEKRTGVKSLDSKISPFSNIGLGLTTIAAGLVSVFVPEEPRQPGEPEKTGLAGVWQYIKEKPLRTAGILLGISTVGHTISGLDDYRKAINAGRKTESAAGQLIFAGTNLAGEGAMAVSSKGHGEGVESDASLKPSIYAIIADLIERSPPEKRETILDLASSYLSKKENLNLPKEEIKAGIETQTQETRNNPWLAGIITRPAASEPSAEPQSKTADWQGMVMNSTTPELSGNLGR